MPDSPEVAAARAALVVLEREPAVDARGDVVFDVALAAEKWHARHSAHVHLRSTLAALDAASDIVEKMRAWTDPSFVSESSWVGECASCGCAETYTYHVPESLWRRVLPEKWWSEVVCAACFHRRATPDYATSLDRERQRADAAEAEVARLRRLLDRVAAGPTDEQMRRPDTGLTEVRPPRSGEKLR